MLPQKPFYMVRHGQSVANTKHIASGGQFDSPLSPLGHEQAQSLSALMDQLPVMPGTLYHSTMIRARDTAMYLNRTLNLPVHAMSELREHDLGIWDGLNWDLVLAKLEANEVPPAGESSSQFSQRIQSVLTDILNNEDNAKPPLIVAHGGLFFAVGMIYEYGIQSVQNCHLHYFEPYPSFDTFPWRVWQFDIAGQKLVKRPAPFCLSQALKKVAP